MTLAKHPSAEGHEFGLPDLATTRNQLTAIRAFQSACRELLIEGSDYGVIPGTGAKPTLLKPGAEKISKLLGLADEYEILEQTKDWEKGFFHYQIRCRLVQLSTGLTISQGLGECNSMETKYRWREQKRSCPICHAEAIVKGRDEYGGGWLCFRKQGGCGAKWADGSAEIESQVVGRVSNEEIYTQVNTLLKMAKKRAMVDAALSAGRLSEVFTQDMEDIKPVDYGPDPTHPSPEGNVTQAQDQPPRSIKQAPPAPTANLTLLNDLRVEAGLTVNQLRAEAVNLGFPSNLRLCTLAQVAILCKRLRVWIDVPADLEDASDPANATATATERAEGQTEDSQEAAGAEHDANYRLTHGVR